MAEREQDYYRPYDSADDSGSDSGTETTDSWYSQGYNQESGPTINSDGIPNFRAFATQVQLLDAAGRSFSTIQEQIKYGTDKLGKYTVFSQYDTPVPDLSGETSYGLTRFETTDADDTNLIMIDSRFRDRTAYPQPTYFSIRLPRTYAKIKSLNFAELKLLTSFYYFRKSKGNTDISIYEQGRTTYDNVNPPYSTIVKSYIREGSYSINTLLTELTTQLNYTPLFFDYINGFNDFISLFKSSGDFFLNFNQPGDTFYNTTTQQFVPNPTVNTIVLRFWNTRYANLSSYTNDQALLAYYYPPLVEFLQDSAYSNQTLDTTTAFQADPSIQSEAQLEYRILYGFTGINPPDSVVLALVKANIPVLDNYRLKHTFRFYLINKYTIGYTPQSQSVYFTTSGLNTSLTTLITNQQAKLFNQALGKIPLTLAQYNAIATQTQQTLAILQGMYNYTQTNFLKYFAVPWSQYTLDYYASNLENPIYLRDGIGASGVPANDVEAGAAGIVPINTNTLLTNLQVNPTDYWPNLVSTNHSTLFMINLSTVQTPSSTLNLVYDINTSEFNTRKTVVDANNYFYTDPLTATANVVCPIDAAKYTVFEFRSPVRQTIQVETLPRPTAYRIPNYNQSNYNSTINEYFNFPYNFSTFSSTYPYTPNNSNYTMAYDNILPVNIIQVPGWSPSNASSNASFYSWNLSYISSLQQYTTTPLINVNTFNRALYFQFTTPQVSNASPDSNYTYGLNLSIQSYTDSTSTVPANPVADCQLFFYHDRAAFQADGLRCRNETPQFYKFSTSITTATSSNTTQFTSYPNQTYYVSVRPNTTNFGSIFLRIVPWFSSSFPLTPQSLSVEGLNPQTDPFKPTFPSLIQTNFNYAQVYDSNWIRLPIGSNLWTANPAAAAAAVNAQLSTFLTAIGYDSNGVSTDYTDYVPFTANSYTYSFAPAKNIGLDPITTYQFQSNSPYNSTIGTYLYPGTLNAVFYPSLSNVYTPATVALRESKIAHYYSVNYLPPSEEIFPLPPSLIGSNTEAQQPYTVATTGTAIPGYSYGKGTQSTIQLSRGALGFNFIPEEGIWDVNRIVFRSAIQDSNNDPNSNIRYIGVYTMDNVLGSKAAFVSLSTAICVLSNTARVSYTSVVTPINSGFDVKGGTYYEFQKDTSFVSTNPIPILGYTQTPTALSDQPESMYTAIAFTKYGSPIPIQALSGSAIPYPFYTSISTSMTYLDGTKAYNSTFGVIYPSTLGGASWPFINNDNYKMFGPQSGGHVTQSQYALSIPIGTSVVNYKKTFPLQSNIDYVYPWNTSLDPSLVIGTIENYLLFQTTNIQIYKYEPLQTDRSLGSPLWTLSADEIYPPETGTSLVAIAGNSSYYYFLGFTNYNNIYYRLSLRRYNPLNGFLYDYNLNPLSYSIPIGGTVASFTINDAEQIILSYKESPTRTRFCYSLQASTILTQVIVPSGQSAIHSMDPHCSTCYWIQTDPITASGSNLYKWSLNQPFPGSVVHTSNQWFGLAAQCASSIPSYDDRVLLVSKTPGMNSNLYFTSNWNSLTQSVDILKNPTQIPVYSGSPSLTVTTGYKGGLWLTVNGPSTLWGTRNTEPDVAGSIESAWQIFYPFQKVVLTKLANNYSPMTDLRTLEYPEFPHTQLFYYKNKTGFLKDTTNQWGQERFNNFLVADVKQRGYYFNSYIYNVPVKRSISSNDYQYITVRGLTPTESSETLFRVNVTNKYSLGYVSQIDLINEISTVKDPSQFTKFTVQYANLLSIFDKSYIQSDSYFGQDAIPNFLGSSINTSNFEEFATNMSTLYGSYITNANLLQSITDYVNSNMYTYITTQLQYIIPPNTANRQGLTNTVSFQILWLSSLLPQYVPLLENWGLGFNLGFNKVDTPPYSTFTNAQSFYKILEDYIYLRLNPEYKMNRMDSTSAENLNITRDSTGQVDQFYGKLLLNNFNSYSTTFVSNQAPFNPPIGRLDTMYFQWVDVGGTQLNDTQCEWTASLTITEAKTKATLSSTLPALPKMAALRK